MSPLARPAGLALAVAALLLCPASLAQRTVDKGDCPQPRFTGKAPPEYYDLKNPLPAASEIESARRIFLGDRSIACATCHGAQGDGRGELSDQFKPPPRNFACAQTVNGVPDGQLFWIIRFGSPGTSMPAHPKLSDEQIWRLVLFLRTLAR